MYGCLASTVYEGPQGDWTEASDRLELELQTVRASFLLRCFKEAIPGSKIIEKGLYLLYYGNELAGIF